MSVRSDQKNRIISLLSGISYSPSVAVSASYISDANAYPYYYIVSGDLVIEWLSNNTYLQKRTYYIFLCYSVKQAVAQTILDDTEGLFVNMLLLKSTRDGNSSYWQDLEVVDVSSPFQDDISFKDNIVFKTITIVCSTHTDYI